MKTLIVATMCLPLVLASARANAAHPNATPAVLRFTVLAQASPSPAGPSPSPASTAASPSPGAEGGRSGITTGAGIVIAAILVGGLLLMRTRLLRR